MTKFASDCYVLSFFYLNSMERTRVRFYLAESFFLILKKNLPLLLISQRLYHLSYFFGPFLKVCDTEAGEHG